MTANDSGFDRRSVLKAGGAVGLGATLPFSGVAGADTDGLAGLVDDRLELASDVLQEGLVVFESRAAIPLLDDFDLAEGYLAFDVLPVAYALLTGPQIEALAASDGVRYVEANRELEYHNADARAATGVDTVQNVDGYRGDSVNAVVIDSGVDGDHPDLEGATNYQWVGNPLGSPTLWAGVGSLDSDEIGHGTHVSGTLAGDGTQSDGTDRGMAPGASLTVYSASAGLSILKAAAAYDDMLANQRNGANYHLVTNSFGASGGGEYNPDGALQTATWEAFQADVLPVFSAGNSGPDTRTLNDFAKAPHVLAVAATDDERAVTDFSSRGRAADSGANYDRQTALSNLRTYYESGSADGPVGLYRNGVGAPGNMIDSTMSPLDPLQLTNADSDPWYARISGTSMSCPVVSGVVALVADAYYQTHGSHPSAIDLLNTVEATATEARTAYTPASMGAGFVDAPTAVDRAEADSLATFDDVTLTDP
ncbi:peptidase S8/S53 subtilisin kexin sedolisin (plasmid) [Halorientalis sp. IM1011]|uniref:S8 family serine peptidase n=1 Tax=Halorientalis sp. IM1011 TaxID=1932360 RepID=UPI00097CC47B|nr:S8 family serine peptidase [Halorientalis sp. IM1011]AQL44646.1 peptidase S8/S53 subtilisin kexin sedolisin [Halorientalis sp. IM1011]